MRNISINIWEDNDSKGLCNFMDDILTHVILYSLKINKIQLSILTIM